MGQSAAKQGDLIQANDMHNVIMPNGAVTPQACNFVGKLSDGCIDNVKINGKPAAVLGSKAKNMVPHVPYPPAVSFQKPPQNEGQVIMGSQTVMIGGKPAARMNDQTQTCTDAPMPPGKVVVTDGAAVNIGG